MVSLFLWTFLIVLIERPSLKDTQGLLRKGNIRRTVFSTVTGVYAMLRPECGEGLRCTYFRGKIGGLCREGKGA